MKTVNHLGTDPIGKLVPRIAFPSMLAQFVSVLYSIVDRMYIGHIASVGDLALAGVGVCGPILTMIGAFSSLIGVGGAPLLGIRLGEKNEKEASRILANAFLMLVSLSLVLTAAALFFTRPMLMAFGASTVTYPYARAYFMIYVSGSVFALLSTGLNQFVICQGFASEGMKSVLLGAILNLLLGFITLYAYRIERRLKPHMTVWITSICITGGFVMAGLGNEYTLIVTLLVFYFCRGIATPVLKDYINRITTSDIRATILSIRSLLIRAFFAAIAPLFGYLTDHFSLRQAFIMLGIVFIVLTITSIFLFLKTLPHENHS